MTKKALIIGYGSIGRRHANLLKTHFGFEIELVTKQDVKDYPCYKDFSDVKDLQAYDYYVIASETYKHLAHLTLLNQALEDKTIFIEKPIFHTAPEEAITGQKNRIMVGYNLRFHECIVELRNLIKKYPPIFVQIHVGQFLPSWRENIHYSESYSASSAKGGGVVLELSHELDYINWIFGKSIEFRGFSAKVSDLKLDCEDIATGTIRTESGTLINLTLDYLSHKPTRKIVVYLNEQTVIFDLMANSIDMYSHKKNDRHQTFNPMKDHTYIAMHQAILEGGGKDVCTYEEALEVLNFATLIKKQGV